MNELVRTSWCSMLSGLLLSAVGCHQPADDGASALRAFRAFVSATFTMQTPTMACRFRTDVRATGAVAEPWEGLLHADINPVDKEESNPFETVDAVFDHTGSGWTCSQTKSKTPEVTMKACETLERFCIPDPVRREDNQGSALTERHERHETTPTSTLYPGGWFDLPPYGEQLITYATKSWHCAVSPESKGVTWKTCDLCRDGARFGCASLSYPVTRTGQPLDKIDGVPAATLSFTPAVDASYEEALAALQEIQPRHPDSASTSPGEGGDNRVACWRNGDSITMIEAGFPIAKGSTVTVMARHNAQVIERCVGLRD